MKKRILAVFLAAVMLASLLSACGGATNSDTASSDETTPSSGQNSVETETATSEDNEESTNEITVGIAQDLDDSLDPYQMTAAGTREVMFNVFEGLIKPNADGDYVDAVASEHSVSDDGLVYTFTLREGVIFHNGAACTTDDVLYSIETCAATTTTTAVAEALSAITDTSVDGNTITFTLAEANSDFIAYMSSVYIIPQGYEDQATQPVGTGPYKYVSRSVQENVILEKNEDYYGNQASIDRVTYKIYEDSTAMMTALNAGALDLVPHMTTDQVNTMTNGYDVLEGTMNLVQALYLNNAYEPFSNELVRQAMCYAVDVDAILELTADGYGTKLGSSMYPSFSKYFEESLADAYPYDVEKAKELLAEAGYGDGFTFTIKVPSNYTPHVNVALVLKEQLAEVGITAEVEQIDWNSWLTDVYSNKDFEATVVGFDASVLTASALLARWCTDSGKNMINYSNTEYDETYAAAQASTDDEEQTELYKRCLEILSETAANVYIQDLAEFVAINPSLKGYEFYPMYVIDMSTLYFE